MSIIVFHARVRISVIVEMISEISIQNFHSDYFHVHAYFCERLGILI